MILAEHVSQDLAAVTRRIRIGEHGTIGPLKQVLDGESGDPVATIWWHRPRRA